MLHTLLLFLRGKVIICIFEEDNMLIRKSHNMNSAHVNSAAPHCENTLIQSSSSVVFTHANEGIDIGERFVFQCCNKWNTVSQMAPCEQGHADEGSRDLTR